MIINQAYLFLIFTVNGILIGILFDIFRVLRKSFKTSDIMTYFQDILFWILTGITLLYSIFTFSRGEIRLYMFLAIFLGCLLYMTTFSKYFIKINVAIISFIKKFISIILMPLKLIAKFARKLLFKPIRFITINVTKFKLNGLKRMKNIFFLEKKKDF